MGWYLASKTFNVPQATLRRRVLGKNKKVTGAEKELGRYQTTFPLLLEIDLIQHIQDLESSLFGLTLDDVRRLAYQLAESNKVDHRFSKEEKTAGWEWLRGFRKRHPELSLRRPEATSAGRAQAFNKPQVSMFFDKLELVLAENNIQPIRIYNADESVLSTVQRPQKILASKGKKQVGSVTSSERGQHATVVCCMSSAGIFIPPAIIFARKKFKNELFDGSPTGTLALINETGRMTGELFLQWLKHFQQHVNSSIDQKVLLLLDGHASHKHVDVLTYAKDNGIIMLSFPPHCTHRLQPLDVAFFGPLKTYYNQEVSKWLRTHPGRVVTQYQMAGLFSIVYGKAASIHNATSGFAKTGIWPLDRDLFPDHVFCAAAVTERSMQCEQHQEDQNKTNGDTLEEAATPPSPPPQDSIISSSSSCATSSSSSSYPIERTSPDCSLSSYIRPVQISPIPSASQTGCVSRKRKHEGSQILTSSPYLNEIKNKAAEKKQLVSRRAAQQERKKLSLADDSDEDIDADDDNDVPCLYCNDLFSNSKPRETWSKCTKFAMWAHYECAGLSKSSKAFICELCE